ncbi:DUF998 domain-containing protein [Actinophytocola sp.]|uniref:DUF998 domain-containing protein n=1 Tax=Actinophytocola sp. TaxID=1872138 RepID=UPI002ED1E7F3
MPALDHARTRMIAALGLVGVGFSVLFVGTLHVVATDVSPVRRTISEYALGEHRWMFDTGVLGLCVGSVLVLLALVRTGLLSWPSPGAVALGVWSVALVVIVAFEKTNRAVGPSVGGVIHRYASLVAFMSVPVAALALGRRWRDDRFAAAARILGTLALVVLGAIVLRIALRRIPGVSELVPLGLAERVLAIIEVATVAVLALWSLRPVIVPHPAGAPAQAAVTA